MTVNNKSRVEKVTKVLVYYHSVVPAGKYTILYRYLGLRKWKKRDVLHYKALLQALKDKRRAYISFYNGWSVSYPPK